MAKYTLTGIAVIIFFLVYNFILAFGSLEGAPQSRTGNPFFPYLSDKPLTEDGYYMLTVAWNIAEGKGFSYNNGIKTTGVQPLAALLYSVPGFFVQILGGDKYTFTRIILILSALLQVIFAFFIYKLALTISNNPDKGLYFLISVCVVLLNFKVLLNFANGLETGLYLILLSLFFLYWISYKQIQPGIMHLLGLGLLFGLLLLCRLDSAIILCTFYLLLVYTRRIKISQLIIIILIGFLVYLPWQLYILDVTGDLLQSSARSQIGFLNYFDKLYQSEQYFSAIIHHMTPFLYTGNIKLWLMFPAGIIYIIFLLVLYKKYKGVLFTQSSKHTLGILTFSILILIIIYFLISVAPYFYFRYLSFLMILSFPVFVVLVVHLFKKWGRNLIGIVLIIMIFSFVIQTYLYLHSGKSALTITMRPTFIKENFDESKLIGAFQTGALGYYVDNVINLDGKINHAALESYEVSSIEQYIDETGIEVLIEWDDAFMWILDSTYLANKWEVYSMDIGDGRTRCYVRKKL